RRRQRDDGRVGLLRLQRARRLRGADSFEYTASDTIETSTTTVSFSVTDTAPHASADSYSMVHDHDLSDNVLDNDSDDDGDGLSVTAVNGETDLSQPITTAHGGSVAMSADGYMVYNPAAGYLGTDSFLYTMSDGVGQDSATVTIEVTDVTPDA